METQRKNTDPSTANAAALFAFMQKTATQVEEAIRLDLDPVLTDNDPLLIEVLRYALFKGGKRLRPVLAIVSSRLCGRDDDTLYLLAAAFEYLHVATLIHDDVIDHAENRRGREAVVKKYGTGAAILAGDWLHARSMRLIGTLTGQRGLDVFCDATQAMVDGEFLQLRYVADSSVTEEQYFAVILRKTARLISSTCEIGALYGNGSPVQAGALATYGEKIGIAFQIVDDLLDYLGEEQATGKQVGNDFAEGKMTLPLIHAVSHAAERDRAELLQGLQGDRRDGTGCKKA
ncbi:MAG: polyprenyl synthetase family protein, partial [Candidatus Electrothrix sp. AR4]|nr:polyprenyl synthetase family protein [Candidatus Electrothrix sp. AR4]